MKPFAETPSRHEPAGELVDDDDLPVLHDVVHVALKEVMGLERLVYMVEEIDVFRVVEVVYIDKPFYLCDAVFSEIGCLRLFIYDKILVFLELIDKPVDLVIFIRRFFGRTGNNKRRSGLINEDAVNLVNDGVVKLALDTFLKGITHIVSQVIEPELIVGSVCDVASVSPFPYAVVQVVDYDAHGEAEECVDRTHPFGVPLREVIVDGNDVDAKPCQCVEIYGEGSNKRFALACGHLGDLSFV